MPARFLILILAAVLAATACGKGDAPDSSLRPRRDATAVPKTTEVHAPIEHATLTIAESDPPRYFLEITSGLTNGCHTLDRTDTRRAGTRITVSVINRVLTGVPCTDIYGTESHSVALGSDFEPGVTYTVRVNDKMLTFTAQ